MQSQSAEGRNHGKFPETCTPNEGRKGYLQKLAVLWILRCNVYDQSFVAGRGVRSVVNLCFAKPCRVSFVAQKS